MATTIYTIGVWGVKPQHEDEFIAAWKDLGVIFSRLPAPPIGKGTLIQSVAEPALFYSFGPWQSLEDVQSMRQDVQAQAGINRLRELCSEAVPGSFRVVAEA
jgi:hypothetical protein